MTLPKIKIIGGGVAGLSAAHELKERGFNVTVYERNANPHPSAAPVALGGKARSFPVHPGQAFEWPLPSSEQTKLSRLISQPAEHGFRFFPGFYRHIIDTLKRIPIGNSKFVIDNLIDIEEGAFAQEGRPLFLFGTKCPNSLGAICKNIKRFLRNPSLGLNLREIIFAGRKLLRGMCMCHERREATLECISWYDYMEGEQASDAYKRVAIDALSQNFVAMDARETSTKTAITILARLIRDLMTPGNTMDRILDGPTNEAWIDPWQVYLTTERPKQPAVTFVNAEIESFKFDAEANRVTGLTLKDGESVNEPDAYYILAVPAEVASKILERTPQLLERTPSLKCIKHLKVNWMNGIVFYLTRDVPMCPGHIIYLNSHWAVTSISQNQFWTKKVSDARPGARANADIYGVVSVIVSDWNRQSGTLARSAHQCGTAAEIATETVAQIRAHFGHADFTADDRWPDDLIVGYCLDPAIAFKQELIGLRSVAEFWKAVQQVRDQSWIKQLETRLQQLIKPDFSSEPALQNIAADLSELDSLLGATLKDQLKEALVEWVQKSAAGADLKQKLQNVAPAERPATFANYLRENLVRRLTSENEEPLFINTVGSSARRPTVNTNTPNLFLASDYVKNATDLATMEGANEAARRAVNAILDELERPRKRILGLPERNRCRIFAFREPCLLAPFRALDKIFFKIGW